MKWKRTKKGSKDHAKDGKPAPADEDDQTLEIDERDESDSEDNFNIQVDSPSPDIDEPPGLKVKTEREESNPFYCSQTKRPDLLSPHHFRTNANLKGRFNHCPPPPPPPPPPHFTVRQNPFLMRETEVNDNQN